MTQLIKWTERKFLFDNDAGVFPALIERLSGTHARLQEKINDAPFMLLTQQDDNKWSIQEHAGHLLDLDELLCKRLDDFEAGKKTLTPADMSNKKTYESLYNEHDIKAILKTFKASRIELSKRLYSYGTDIILKEATHPRLNKPMKLIDCIYFFAEHDDHHLAAITNIIRKNN